MRDNGLPRPPQGRFTSEARRLWRRVVSEWDFDDAALVVLERACEAFQRMREAQAQLAKDGSYYVDKSGNPRAHPALGVEKDSRTAMLNAIKMLGISLEPVGDVGRPPGT